MRKEIIFVVLCVIVIFNSTCLGAINIFEKIDTPQDENLKFIQLKDDDLKKLNEFIESIKDLEIRRKAQEILDLIITDDDKLDIETVEKLALEYNNF
jgi:hypothetical protein